MNRSSRRKTLAIFVLIVTSNLSASGAEISLRSQCTCRNSVVRLSDVAELRGMRGDEAREFSRIELVVAPNAKSTRVVGANEIRELLSLHGMDVAKVRLTGAEQVTIRSSEAAREPTPQSGAPAGEGPAMVVIAGRTVARGEILRPADVQLQSLPSKRRATDVVERLEDAVGWETTRAIEAGQPIERSFIHRPVLVRRGELVTVVAKAAGVRVRTSCRATEDGAVGDLITVETTDKLRQKLAARVVAIHEVEIYAGGPTVPASSDGASIADRAGLLK